MRQISLNTFNNRLLTAQPLHQKLQQSFLIHPSFSMRTGIAAANNEPTTAKDTDDRNAIFPT